MVRAALATTEPELASEDAVLIRVIKTTGDHVLNRPLAEIGGKGLFTKEIDDALLAGAVDLAVHSMKDVPTLLPDGLVIAAMLPRADVRDALIAPGRTSIAALPARAVVGTASLRRKAQILARRSDLQVVPLRGNVQTRLRKLAAGEVAATLLAMAGLHRLGLQEAATSALSTEEMLPAVAQGAIGIEARRRDQGLAAVLARLSDAPTFRCVVAERGFLAALEGSCRTPIAALAELDGDQVRFRGLVARPDGQDTRRIERRAGADEAEALGAALGAELRGSLPPGYLAA
jgi:hydroxymethylbilane synthase